MSLFGKSKAIVPNIYVPTDVKTVGSHGTTRYPLSIHEKKGTLTNGYFSVEQTIPDKETRFHETMDKAKKDFPDFIAYISLLESCDYEAGYDFCVKMRSLSGGELRPIFSDIVEKMGGSPHLAERLMELPNFYYDHQDIIEYYVMAHERSKNYLDDLQLKPGEPIIGRNVAYYRLAKALGYEDLTCRAYPLSISLRGTPMDGVFMESCKGVDLGNLKESDTLAITWGANAEETDKANFSPAVMREINDIVVLDYLCSNIDRHGANLIYTFEEVEGVPQLTHVRGFDNDVCFGLCTLETEKLKYATPLKDLKIISSGMKRKIMSAKDSDILSALKGTVLTSEEKDACVQRLNLLKNYLTDASQYSLTVAEDEDYPRFYDELIKDQDGLFELGLHESYLRVTDRLNGEDEYSEEDRIVFTSAYYL